MTRKKNRGFTQLANLQGAGRAEKKEVDTPLLAWGERAERERHHPQPAVCIISPFVAGFRRQQSHCLYLALIHMRKSFLHLRQVLQRCQVLKPVR